MDKIGETLDNLFDANKVIFWYDKEEEFRDDYEKLDLDGIEKITYSENPFYIKYLVSKKEADQKILLYFPFEQPKDEQNWLLDLQLAHHIFHSDPAGMYLQELGIQYELKPVVENHLAFFKSKKRRRSFDNLYDNKDSYDDCKEKMLAVAFNVIETDVNNQLLQYADSIPSEKEEKLTNDLERFNLKGKFWERVSSSFDYQNEDPSIYDFLLTIFNYHFPITEAVSSNYESKILLSRWKRTKGLDQSFETISEKVQGDLQIKESLQEADLSEVLSDDLFSLTDKRVLSELVSRLTEGNIPLEKVQEIIQVRKNKYWYKKHRTFYEAVNYAALLIDNVKKLLNNQDLSIETLDDGAQQYAAGLYKIDSFYRKFIYSYRNTKQNSLLKPLADKVEKVYSNDWLLKVNNEWQKAIDNLDEWPTKNSNSQQQFFKEHIKPYTDKQQRLFVVVTDALRFEAGHEFYDNISNDDRFVVDDLSYMLSSLPSYTQLGMASLLPHNKLTVDKQADTVRTDGASTVGTSSRAKVLNNSSGVRSTAIGAEKFLNMHSKKDGREFVKGNDLIYIYHNTIDKVGDNKDSEERVFEAVEEELGYLIGVLRQINSIMPNSKVMVTSDHGFIYQNDKLHESDFAISDVEGDVWKKSRRFILGKNLKGNNAFTHFRGDQLGLQNDLDVLIPKTINRLRLRGAGSRYVHGGASLQETIVPLIPLKVVSKKDQEQRVDVDIIKNSDKISTNILPVSFVQTEAVTESNLPRTIKAALYEPDGERISDEFVHTFDYTQDSERNREAKHTFQLSNFANKYYGDWVKLRLEQPIKGSNNKWQKYEEFSYQLVTSFTNDFDDF
jgi:uncharacterized protein (TIGR02687 family)